MIPSPPLAARRYSYCWRDCGTDDQVVIRWGLYWWGVVYAGVGLPGGPYRPLARPEVSACERCASISLFILKLRLTYRLDVSTILPVRLTCATRRPAPRRGTADLERHTRTHRCYSKSIWQKYCHAAMKGVSRGRNPAHDFDILIGNVGRKHSEAPCSPSST